MSKLQLLYEKLMRIAYIFGGVFFVLALIDFSAAMMTGAFSCSSGTCRIGEEHLFYQYTLVPLIILTILFFIAGYVLFKMAHKESDLLSVSDYKKTLEVGTESDEVISREELYEKLQRGNRKPKVQKVSFFKRIGNSISEFSDNMKKRREEAKANRAKHTAEAKAAEAEAQKVEEQRIEKEKQERARTKLNKTGLILLLSKNTDLTQNNARLFVNSMLEAIKDSVIDGEEVKLAKFGRFEKVHIEEHVETDPETGVETKVEEHNTVQFFAYKPLLEKLNEGITVVEEPETEKVDAPTKEEKQAEPVQEEPVIAEKVEEPKEEAIVEPVEEVKVEEVQPEPTTEEPVKEVQSEPVQEELKIEVEPTVKEPVVVEEKVEEKPAAEETVKAVEEVQPEPQVEKEESKPVEVAKKPAKPKASVKTKKQIIEMMDETTDLSKNKANKFLKFFAEVVKEQLIQREDVELEGIGFFTTIEMPAKEAVNPQTNEKIIVPAHHQVRLRFDEDLKDKMNDQN